MTHKKPTTRSACNQALAQAMAERQEHLHVIHDAKHAIMRIEHDMKRELIRQGRDECLKIDWKAVRRAISF
jgi:hypothetical protein